MYYPRRKQLSQNFLTSRKQVKDLVGSSSIAKTDQVLEIGPGKGIITQQLLQSAGSVCAIEIDSHLVTHLENIFADNPTFWIFHGDILEFPLPTGDYKVFSNIPFSIEGQIARKLLDSSNPPQDCYLVVRRELAERLSGVPHENKFSLTHKINFEFEIIHHFKRSDFTPKTRVNCVLWRIKKRDHSLIPTEKQDYWKKLIGIGIGEGESLHKNLAKITEEKEIRALCKDLEIGPKTKPSYLSFEKWLEIYKFLKKN